MPFLTEGAEVRGIAVRPGDLGFIYREESGDFVFGNVEDLTEDGFLISSARTDWERRNPATCYAVDRVLFAAEINNRTPERGYAYKANEIVLKTEGLDRAEAFAVLASQEQPGHPLLLAKITFVQGRGWSVTGEAHMAECGTVYHPQTLASIQGFRFRMPVHPLFDVLRQKAGLAMNVQQAAVLSLKGVDVPVNAALRVLGHEVEIHLDAHYLVSSYLGGVRNEFIVDERLTPINDPKPAWHAQVAISGVTHKADADAGYSGSVHLIPRSVEVTHSEYDVVATSEVYCGAPMNAWSDHVHFREPPIDSVQIALGCGQAPNAVFLDCFGAPAIIHHPGTHEASEADYLALVRLGPPLESKEHAALTAFVGYITGGRASNALTETFSLENKIKTIINDRGAPTTRKQLPIPVDRATPYARLITRHFSQLLQEFLRWREVDEKSFDALFHHYAEGVDSNYPVTRTLRLAVAFEAFVNLVTQDKAENESIVDAVAYRGLRADLGDVLAAYSEAHRAEIPKEAQRRFDAKLDNLNSGSNTRRIKRFWDLVPIRRSKEDDELLRRLRNESVHKGFLGGDGQIQDLLGDAENADRLCDMLNRAILCYAKYTGPVLSSRDGRWMDAKSGDTYRVPRLPKGPTLEIKHNVPIPSTSVDEDAAIKALRSMQRERDSYAAYIVDDNIRMPDY